MIVGEGLLLSLGDDSWWWFMVTVHGDGSWWRFMVMVHGDGSWWWFMVMVVCTQTVGKSATSKTPAWWQHLADTLLEETTAIAVSNSLLTVGGLHNSTASLASTAIHLYHFNTLFIGKVNFVHYFQVTCVISSVELNNWMNLELGSVEMFRAIYT